VWRWKDVDVGHAEVVVDVLVGEDLGMSYGVFASLVDPQVQGSHVDVFVHPGSGRRYDEDAQH